MRQEQLVGMDPVSCHQEPAGQPLLDGMAAFAGHLLCKVAHANLDVTIEHRAQGGIRGQQAPQCVSMNPEGPPCGMYNCRERGGIDTQDE